MQKNIIFFFKQLAEKLWFRPLMFCLFSIAAALLAHLADDSFIVDIAPNMEKSSVEDLLSTLSSSMLVIAIFAVGAMLSAFAAASGTATPRSFKLIVADDVSQNALSIFIGSFIYSIVATIALKNGFYGEAGYFVLFILTILVFATVIITFLRWVERISKLGRLSHTIKKVEDATADAIKSCKTDPFLGGTRITNKQLQTGKPFYSNKIGYVQHINMDQLQKFAERIDATLALNSLPGTFMSPDKPLVYLISGDPGLFEEKIEQLDEAFIIKDTRSFPNDPRFGLIALTEIGSRALSPGINDPGTAIAIIGSHVRLFSLLIKDGVTETAKVKYNRIEVPELSVADMFDDAFRPLARDGASNIEVMLRLQKALTSIYYIGSNEHKELLAAHSRQAFERAELAMEYSGDVTLLKEHCILRV